MRQGQTELSAPTTAEPREADHRAPSTIVHDMANMAMLLDMSLSRIAVTSDDSPLVAAKLAVASLSELIAEIQPQFEP